MIMGLVTWQLSVGRSRRQTQLRNQNHRAARTTQKSMRLREIGDVILGRSEGATSRREVEPYRLVQMDRSWYLHAFDPSRGDWRTFRLDRTSLKRPDTWHRLARWSASGD